MDDHNPIRDAIEAAQPPPARFPMRTVDELLQEPAMRWRVRGVLPESGLAVMYGPPASGKSFLVLGLAAAIANGDAWFGHRTHAAPVVYCALEGEGGVALRAKALRVRFAEGGVCPLAGVRFTHGPLDVPCRMIAKP